MSASRVIQVYELLQERYGYSPERALQSLKNRTAGIGMLATDADIDEAVELIESGAVQTLPSSDRFPPSKDDRPPVLHRIDLDG